MKPNLSPVHAVDLPSAEEPSLRGSVAQGGPPAPARGPFAAPSGAAHPQEAVLHLLRDVNEKLLMAALDAQQVWAEAEIAHQRQTAFITTLAHELRAPLSPIRNAAAMLSHSNSTDLLPFVQGIIERQVDHVTRLIEDLLDTTRMRTGKLRLLRTVVDLRAIVDAAVQTCRPAITARAQQLLIKLPATTTLINADPVRMTQVLNNLLGNASKYTPRGGSICLAVHGDSATTTIVVTDNGIGITASALKSVFEPYVQEPHAVGHDPSGLGLGLTVAHDLVRAHGGQIFARSDGLGCGSRFEIELPIVPGSLEDRRHIESGPTGMGVAPPAGS